MPITKHKYYLYTLYVLVFVLSTNVYAQFTVKNQSNLTVKSKLSSKEGLNTFKSNVSGDGTLLFVNKHTIQKLITVDDVSLPSVSIADADYWEMLTPLTVKGSITVTTGTLIISYPLSIYGDLVVDEKDVNVIGHKNIIYKDLSNPIINLGITSNSLYHNVLNVSTHINQFRLTIVHVNSNNLNTHYVNTLISDYCIIPLKPPPENC